MTDTAIFSVARADDGVVNIRTAAIDGDLPTKARPDRGRQG
ncbi:hypothetical protein [Brevundimonas sp.]|nr:hypothetical protein [Brevundimonas sp.]